MLIATATHNVDSYISRTGYSPLVAQQWCGRAAVPGGSCRPCRVPVRSLAERVAICSLLVTHATNLCTDFTGLFIYLFIFATRTDHMLVIGRSFYEEMVIIKKKKNEEMVT